MSAPSATLPDRVRVHPASLEGRVAVTGDKSISHRCLIVAALAPGDVAVAGLAPSADVRATADALRQLGVTVSLTAGADGRLEGSVVGSVMEHAGDVTPALTIDCGNSGTTLRLLAGVAAGAGRHVILDGDASLRRRPVDRIMDPLAAMGVRTDARDGRLPPLEVHPSTVRPVRWTSPVASAQVKSAVLLAAIAAGVEAAVLSPFASRDHTERMLQHAGVTVTTTIDATGRELVELRPGPVRVTALSAPRDPSAAAFWQVAAACGSGAIDTPGLCLNPGRTGALDVLRRMGAAVDVRDERTEYGEPAGTVRVAPAGLRGARIDGALVVRCLDELPILAIAGAISADGLQVRDAAELRVKESDRISVLASSLRAVGIVIEEHDDGFDVPGGQRPGPGTVDAHGDHRIAMTAAVAASVGTGPVDITGFRAVGTSYPAFLTDLEALGGRWETIDG